MAVAPPDDLEGVQFAAWMSRFENVSNQTWEAQDDELVQRHEADLCLRAGDDVVDDGRAPYLGPARIDKVKGRPDSGMAPQDGGDTV